MVRHSLFIAISSLLLLSFGAVSDEQVFWGDTHLHTSNSGDAFFSGNLTVGPDEAYRFASGQPLVHPGHGVRVQLSVPLDFLVIADHAEYLGVPRYIYEQGVPREELSLVQKLFVPLVEWWYRRSMDAGGSGPGFSGVTPGTNDVQLDAAKPMPDTIPGSRAMMRSTWAEMTATAEAHYRPGEFTTLIGWEWTSNAGGANLHRVVFTDSGQEVANQFYPFSSMESKYPYDLWRWLEEVSESTGADFVAIPHNSNISKGYMFPLTRRLDGVPLDTEWSALRAKWEPVVEVTQIKGDSETHPAFSPDDAFADFETYTHYIQQDPPPYRPEPGDFVRHALKSGLILEQSSGINPYGFGLIGSTDSHTGLASAEEPNFWGKMARNTRPGEALERTLSGEPVTTWSMSAAGLAGVWAAENTREAIFEAFKRREVYATTGPRMVVRVYAGNDLNESDLQSVDTDALRARGNVPMGGELRTLHEPLRLLIQAIKDPRGAPLERVQVIKGWYEAGAAYEKVFDVEVSADAGSESLATLWTDPEFDATQPAFYYVRVLQVPTPRHSTLDAIALGIERDVTGEANHIQERAYTSPVFYSP